MWFIYPYASELFHWHHYDDVIMGTIASQITSLPSVYSTVYSGADQSKHQSSASLAFVWGIHRGPVNSPHKWPVTRKMFPFDDVIMCLPPSKHNRTQHNTRTVQIFWGTSRGTTIMRKSKYPICLSKLQLRRSWPPASLQVINPI